MALRRSKRAANVVGGGHDDVGDLGTIHRVLVVNDEPEACELLVRLLSTAGNEVERARDHPSMADRLGEPPRLDCVVLDVSTSGIGGNLKLLDAVRSHRDIDVAAIPVVLVSNGLSSAMFSWQAGADELLVRPFRGDELVTAVASAIARPPEERPKHRRRQLDAAKAGGRR